MERENREREREIETVGGERRKQRLREEKWERELGCAYRWEGAGITEETIETLFTWNM